MDTPADTPASGSETAPAEPSPNGGRTRAAAERYAHDATTAVVPTEYARALTVLNPPGATALKILLAMVDHAGPAIGELNRWYELPFGPLIHTTGIRHLTVQDGKQLLKELTAMQVGYKLLDAKGRFTRIRIGVVMQDAELEYDGRIDDTEQQQNPKAPHVIRFRFGGTFGEITRDSAFWTTLEKALVWRFRSRYAIALYQHLASTWDLRAQRVTIPLEECRQILGVLPARLVQFKHFNGRALQPAIREINARTQGTVSASFEKLGRRVIAVQLAWSGSRYSALSDAPDGTPDGPQDGPHDRPHDSASASFPASGSIAETPWAKPARTHCPDYDPDTVARDFRTWQERRGIPLEKAGALARWDTFCVGYTARQSRHGTPRPRTDPNVPATERSPLSDFPRDGKITDTPFQAIVRAHAPKGTKPDVIGAAYADYQTSLSPRLLSRPAGAGDHEADFTLFCQQYGKNTPT